MFRFVAGRFCGMGEGARSRCAGFGMRQGKVMRRYWKYAVVFLFGVIYLGTVWQRPLFAPDEFRYSEIPREMIASGDWVVPRLAGMPYFEKPILGYWLNAAAMKLVGEQPAACRLPGALAMLLTAGVIWLFCRRANAPKPAMVAPVVFLLSGLVFGVGTYGVLDPPLTFFLTLTMTMLYFAWGEKRRLRQAGYLALAGVGCGLAFLTKGFLAFALPGVAMFAFLLWQKEWKRLFTLPWIPLIFALLVAAPWAIAVHRAAPDFWHHFIVIEHFQRAQTGASLGDERGEPFWYYLPVLAAGLLPWLFFLPAFFRPWREHWRTYLSQPFLRFCVCCAGLWFVLFSIVSSKLGTYILPCFPWLAVLVGWGLLQYAGRGDFRTADRVVNWVIRVLLPLPVGLFLWQTIGRFTDWIPADWMVYSRNENYFLPVLAVMVMLIWFKLAAKETVPARKFAYFCAGIGFVALAVHSSMPMRFLEKQNQAAFLRNPAVAAYLSQPGVTLAADSTLATAASWVLRRDDLLIYEKPGEFLYGIEHGGADRHLTPAGLAERLEKGEPVLVLLASGRRNREMPSPAGRTRVRIKSGRFYAVYYPGGER